MPRWHTQGWARERLLRGLPVQERRLDVNGVATVVLEGGQGPPLVLLHGGIPSGGAYWAPVIPRLAERHRLVVPDVPGLGESEPVARLDPAVFANWFAALLRLTCQERPALFAHSLLGSLAARFAAQHGDLLRRLVLWGTPGIGPYRIPLGLLVTAPRFDLRPSDRNQKRFTRWAFLDPERTRQHDPEWFDAFNAYGRSCGTVPHNKRTMRYLMRTCTKQVPDTEVRRIKVPTALLWGRQDRFVPLRVAQCASSRLGWPLHVIEESGHVPQIERPAAFLDAFADATRERGSTMMPDGRPS